MRGENLAKDRVFTVLKSRSTRWKNQLPERAECQVEQEERFRKQLRELQRSLQKIQQEVPQQLSMCKQQYGGSSGRNKDWHWKVQVRTPSEYTFPLNKTDLAKKEEISESLLKRSEQ
jgi:hypothetical protein